MKGPCVWERSWIPQGIQTHSPLQRSEHINTSDDFSCINPVLEIPPGLDVSGLSSLCCQSNNQSGKKKEEKRKARLSDFQNVGLIKLRKLHQSVSTSSGGGKNSPKKRTFRSCAPISAFLEFINVWTDNNHYRYDLMNILIIALLESIGSWELPICWRACIFKPYCIETTQKFAREKLFASLRVTQQTSCKGWTWPHIAHLSKAAL